MSDYIKWAAGTLIVFSALVVVSGVIVLINTDNVVMRAITEANAWLGNYSPYLVKGRKLLNNFLNPYVLNVSLWFSFLYPLVQWGIAFLHQGFKAIFK